MRKEFIERAGRLISDSSHCTLTSIDANGYPRTTTMPIIKGDGLKKSWFVTWYSSDKVKNFKKNPKAGMCCSNMVNGDNVALTGDMTIVSDLELKKQLWTDAWLGYFPGGYEDPNFCLLEFTTNFMRIRVDYRLEECAV